MKISEYIKDYTNGQRVKFKEILAEVNELLVEVFKLNFKGMAEEFEDVWHFLQLWLFWRFGLDGETWWISRHSVQKFVNRKKVWNRIYVEVGLSENISGYVGNYKKIEKVINHLAKFGIPKEKAEIAYQKIVLEK